MRFNSLASVVVAVFLMSAQVPAAMPLNLDLSAPRLIQPSVAADGLFNTGHIDGPQAGAVRVVAVAPVRVASAAAGVAGTLALAESAQVNCEEWNTYWFFETSTVEDVTACLHAGADANARAVVLLDLETETPLHRVIQSYERAVVETLLMVEALLAAGADATAKDFLGRTPLHLAAENWRTENAAVIEALLAAGADVTARDHEGRTPLHVAAENWRTENAAVVEALLAAGADVTVRDYTGSATPLHLAAENLLRAENIAVVEALLAAGADVTAQDRYGATPLHSANVLRNHAAVMTLLASGADPAARGRGLRPVPRIFLTPMGPPRGEYDQTPLHIAAWYSEPAVIEALLAAGAEVGARGHIGETALHFAARNNEPAVVETLLAAGAEVGARDRAGATALHFAARYNEPAVVEMLLAAGAEVGARDHTGETALHFAAGNENAAVAEMLLAAGAEVGARDRFGKAPVHFAAASNGNAVVIEMLLAAGAAVGSRDAFGNTPLHEAAGNMRNAVVVEMLLTAGADVATRNTLGRTPLHRAAGNHDNRPAIEVLIAAGAHVDASDENGDTPLHLAARYSHIEFYGDVGVSVDASDAIEALLDAGANPAMRNAAGETPLDLAYSNYSGTDAYRRLNEARADEPVQASGRPGPARAQVAAVPQAPWPRQGPVCEVPGYRRFAARDAGVSWCALTLDYPERGYVDDAAEAWCAISTGTSSSLEEVLEQHQRIETACDALDELSVGDGSSCRCPAGYRR